MDGPGNSVHGRIAFDLPTGVKAVKAVQAKLHDSIFSRGVTISLRPVTTTALLIPDAVRRVGSCWAHGDFAICTSARGLTLPAALLAGLQTAAADLSADGRQPGHETGRVMAGGIGRTAPAPARPRTGIPWWRRAGLRSAAASAPRRSQPGTGRELPVRRPA